MLTTLLAKEKPVNKATLKKQPRLTLSKETLRTLEQPELRAAMGGVTLNTCYKSCDHTCTSDYC